jgi:Concanavalin A-like lectin/glucanases superfamily/Pectate lyase superfamily protein/Bacterial Ig-like domain (group 2)/Secretion system C-terminal sorting domain
MKKILIFLFFATSILELKAQDNMYFPADGGAIDVTKAPYFADNTGATDVTAKIQMALDSSGGKNLIYLPNGTYLVSNTIRWPGKQSRDVLQGQSTTGTIIKLANNAPGYGDPALTKAVIWTGKAPAQRFHNHIRNLTVNTGTGNPGATGIQFMSNNQGGMEKVTIISGDGTGLYGLDLGYSDEQGPCLIKGIKVVGFQTGIRTKYGVDGVVMCNIILQNQTVYGLLNDGQCLSVENLQFTGSVPGLVNRSSGVLAIINSTFTGTGNASAIAAISNIKGMFARNITTTGFLKAIENSGAGTGKVTSATNITEFVSHEVLGLFTSPKQSLNLPILQTPEIPLAPLTDWVSVRSFAPRDTILDGNVVENWTPAIQKAIDSGKSTVYFPEGFTYQFFGTVYVRGNVKRIIGLESEVREYGIHNGTLEIVNGTSPEVIIEKFDSHYAQWKVIHKSNRVLVLKNIWMDRLTVEAGAGDVFLEDARIDRIGLAAGEKLYARQLNMESSDNPHEFLNSGTTWILGVKTENDQVVVNTKSGGKTEIIGGFIYANKAGDPNKVMFVNDEGSSFSGTVGEYVIRNQPFNPVQETREGVTKTLKFGQAYSRSGASMLPLYTGYRPAATANPAAPTGLNGTTPRYDQAKLTWTDNSTTEDAFVIQRKTGTAGTYVTIGVANANIVSYNDSTLTAATTYIYRIKSVNAFGSSAYSAEKTLTTPGFPAPPSAPSNLTAVLNATIKSQVTLSWNDNSNFENGFYIEKRKQGVGSFVQIAIVPANTVSFIDYGLDAGTTYEYRARSWFETVASPYSGTATATGGTAREEAIYWQLNDYSGIVAADGSGRGRTGDLFKGVNFDANSAEGVVQKSLDLDGIDDYIRHNNPTITDYPFTMSVWMKTDKPADQTVAYLGSGTSNDFFHSICLAADGKGRIVSRDGAYRTLTGTKIINDDNWHLLTGVFESPISRKLYVDGVLEGTQTTSVPFNAPNMTRFTVGRNDRITPYQIFRGNVDDVKLIPRALTATEIATLAQANIQVTGISVSPASANIVVTQKVQLVATITPSNATNKIVKWTSSDSFIATVSSSGLVTGVTPGTVVITGTTQNGNKIDNTTITVSDGIISDPVDIALYTFNTASTASSDVIASIQAGNFTDGPGIVGGTAFVSNTRGVNHKVTPILVADALTNQDYFTFTVTPNAGRTMNFIALSIIARRGAQSPSKMRVYSSVDNYTSFFDISVAASAPNAEFIWNLTAPIFQGLSSAVTFRIYTFGATGTDQYSRLLIDNVRLNATVTGGLEAQSVSNKSERVSSDAKENNDKSPDESGVTLYPNPVAREFTILLPSPLEGPGSLTMYSLDGRQQLYSDLAEGNSKFNFNIEHLKTGVYIINVYDGKVRSALKIIKE